jgi:hypothetical protein
VANIQCQNCIRTSSSGDLNGDNLPWRRPHCRARHFVDVCNTVMGLKLADRFHLPRDLRCSVRVMATLNEAVAAFTPIPRWQVL